MRRFRTMKKNCFKIKLFLLLAAVFVLASPGTAAAVPAGGGRASGTSFSPGLISRGFSPGEERVLQDREEGTSVNDAAGRVISSSASAPSCVYEADPYSSADGSSCRLIMRSNWLKSFSLSDGSLWGKVRVRGDLHCSLVTAGGRYAVVRSGSRFDVYSIPDLKPLWSRDWTDKFKNGISDSAVFWPDRAVVFAEDPDSGLLLTECTDLSSGRTLWQKTHSGDLQKAVSGPDSLWLAVKENGCSGQAGRGLCSSNIMVLDRDSGSIKVSASFAGFRDFFRWNDKLLVFEKGGSPESGAVLMTLCDAGLSRLWGINLAAMPDWLDLSGVSKLRFMCSASSADGRKMLMFFLLDGRNGALLNSCTAERKAVQVVPFADGAWCFFTSDGSKETQICLLSDTGLSPVSAFSGSLQNCPGLGCSALMYDSRLWYIYRSNDTKSAAVGILEPSQGSLAVWAQKDFQCDDFLFAGSRLLAVTEKQDWLTEGTLSRLQALDIENGGFSFESPWLKGGAVSAYAVPSAVSAQSDNDGKAADSGCAVVTSAGMAYWLNASGAETASLNLEPFFNWTKLNNLCGVIALAGCIVWFIFQAKGGKKLFIRRIAGLSALDEAVGRATEMGKPVLYIPGVGDIDDTQTMASLSILSHVSSCTADYDIPIMVPNCTSVVMSMAQDVTCQSYMKAGRPDSYVSDYVCYLSDEQFGFAAGVCGIMVRERPAAILYMGNFLAEALMLAETGNSTGAIQIAGTASASQLPFFVAACDYTLIGEELYAASAYLSDDPLQIGSLKGQDAAKAAVMLLIAVGVICASCGWDWIGALWIGLE